MEDILADDPLLELQIDGNTSESLENGSWWARFNAIIFIGVVVVVLIALIVAMDTPAFQDLQLRVEIAGLGAVIWMILAAAFVVMGVFISLLMNFAVKTLSGVREANQDKLEKGMASLKIYFILSAILGIVTLTFSIINLFN